ncbi:MAG: class I SAM-dependent methyltransferase [Gemmatimonas sp.]
MATDKRFLDGYITDSMYPSMFHHRFTPSWTDSFLPRHRVPSPRTLRGAFTFVDAGCGDGFGLIVNAIAHPEGQFFGFDMSADQIERGQQLIRALGLRNITLQRMTLADASLEREADYVMSQGVLSWVDAQNQAALWSFASRTLKPGGLFVVGYNVQPGWAHMYPFQRLMRAFSEPLSGDAMERFVEGLKAVRVTGAVGQAQLEQIDNELESDSSAYLPHEYLNKFWSAMWSGDVIETASAHNFDFVQTAAEHRIRNDFVFTKAQRDALRVIESDTTREVTSDILLNTKFRTDIYVKRGYQQLSPAAAQQSRLQQFWAAQTPVAGVSYFCDGPAGQLKFDNRAAQILLTTMERGPTSLNAIPNIAAPDLLNTIDALFAAGLVRPVESPSEVPHARAFNNLVFSAQVVINALVGAFGSTPSVHGTARFDSGAVDRLGIALY